MEFGYGNSGNTNVMGWVCPNCGRCYSPSVKQCEPCGPADAVVRLGGKPVGKPSIPSPMDGRLPTSDDLYKKYPAVDLQGKSKGDA